MLLNYLDYFRGRVIEKLEALPPDELRISRLPSGWTPIELVQHLTFMERRWFVWGFAGEHVAEPWGDQHGDRWHVPDDESLAGLAESLLLQGERTRGIVSEHDLGEAGRPGPRWDGAEPASLERVLLHVIQEYARHLGQLDIVCELAAGSTGE